jgi:isocitrate lyase
MDHKNQIKAIEKDWNENPRWGGIKRSYDAAQVVKLRGSVRVEHTLATRGAARLWDLMHDKAAVRALGAMTGNQAIEMVEAGLSAIYLSGWQIAGDANTALQMYPDQSLYPVDSGPRLVRAINNALQRADQIAWMEGRNGVDWMAPIVADAEAGFGGPLNTFELIRAFIEAGAAGVHLEDQLSSLKKCGHLGGKVLVPKGPFIDKLNAARLAADVLDVPTVIIARTDADSASLLHGDIDETDRPFIEGERTSDGHHVIRGGLDLAIARSLAYAPYADLLWCETSTPDLEQARQFAQAIHAEFPDRLLAYNCSPSFNWRKNLGERDIAVFQDKLGEMGYAFQFVTLAGFHSLNANMFELARDYGREGMAAYSRLQEREFSLAQSSGYRAVRHQSFVGTGWFDCITEAVSGGDSSTTALRGSTEQDQFNEDRRSA